MPIWQATYKLRGKKARGRPRHGASLVFACWTRACIVEPVMIRWSPGLLVILTVDPGVGCVHPGPGGARQGGRQADHAAADDGFLSDVPSCGRAVAAVDPHSLGRGRVGEVVHVRGVLVHAGGSCEQMQCWELDPEGRRLHREVTCCNHCGGWLRLLETRDAHQGAKQRPASASVLVQRPGQSRPLSWVAQDCELAAFDSRAHAEIVVTGVLRAAGDEEFVGMDPQQTFIIDQASLCATGVWSATRLVSGFRALPAGTA